MVKIFSFFLFTAKKKKKKCRNDWKPLLAEDHLVMDLICKRLDSISMEMEHA